MLGEMYSSCTHCYYVDLHYISHYLSVQVNIN